MRAAVILAVIACLSGCALTGERQPHRYFVLEPRPAATGPQRRAILPAPTTAASFYDTQDIAFSRAPGTRGHYQFSHWTERPQRVLQGELAARCAPAGAAHVLETHVVEMYHDASTVPGTSRITVTAELREQETRVAVARRTFTREAPAAAHDAAGAVAGFNEAVAALLDDIVEWADREAAARGGR